PSYPRVCFWPDSVRALLSRSDAFPLLTPNWEKRYLPLDGLIGCFQSERRPLGAIYLLAARSGDRHAPCVEEITPKEALLELVQNSYMNWPLDREQRAREFDVLTHLVEQVPIRRLVPSCDPGQIDELCRAILADSERVRSDAYST